MKIFGFAALALLTLSFPALCNDWWSIPSLHELEDPNGEPYSDAASGFSDLLEELDCYEEADEDNDGEPDHYDEEEGYYSECNDDEVDDDD